jgi:S-formylglutathione hydrolase
MTDELPIAKYVTHEFEGLDKVNEIVDLMHAGTCLRGVVKIGANAPAPTNHITDVKVLSTQKFCGGYLKKVKHWSQVNKCHMIFYIYMPEDDIRLMRRERYPALYFLGGLTCNWENATFKSGFAPYAKKHNIAMVFPDTSPRDIDETCPGVKDAPFTYGYGAGHYCNATQAPWKEHFNMFDYVTEELPNLVSKYFFVDPERKSISGFSMGGAGALVCAIKTGAYKSVTSFAAICAPTKCEPWAKAAYE